MLNISRKVGRRLSEPVRGGQAMGRVRELVWCRAGSDVDARVWVLVGARVWRHAWGGE